MLLSSVAVRVGQRDGVVVEGEYGSNLEISAQFDGNNPEERS